MKSECHRSGSRTAHLLWLACGLGFTMRAFFVLTILFGVGLFCVAAEVPFNSQEVPVWYWQDKGRGQNMKLEVRLDNKTIFTTTYSVAQTNRAAVPTKSHNTRIRFSFKPERSIVWSGYRDEDEISPAKQRIDG